MFARETCSNWWEVRRGLKLIDELLGLEQDPRVHRDPQASVRMLLKSDEAAGYAAAKTLMEGELKDSDFGLYTPPMIPLPDLKTADHALEVAMATSVSCLRLNSAVHELLGIEVPRGDADGADLGGGEALEVMKNPQADEPGGGRSGEAAGSVQGREGGGEVR